MNITKKLVINLKAWLIGIEFMNYFPLPSMMSPKVYGVQHKTGFKVAVFIAFPGSVKVSFGKYTK